MAEVLRYLELAEAGQPAAAIATLGRMITMNYEPAPTLQVQEWAETVLEAWSQLKGD